MDREALERIEQLEVRIAYGERMMDELNSVITAQWREIEALRRDFGRLTERLAEVEAAGPPEDEPPPPHY